MDKRKFGGLGKGLGVIFMENDSEDDNKVVVLRISEIEPNKNQPRKEFDEEALSTLAESMQQYGVLQPIVVKPNIDTGYTIVAGERRYRAARIAGLSEIPAIIKDLSDSQVMEIALVENLQREDLLPLEEALGYKELMDKYGYTQETLSKAVGKSRSSIGNQLRLLNLPDEIKDLMNSKELSSGHAKALLSLDDNKKMIEVAKEVAKKDLSVRQTEALCKSLTREKKTVRKQDTKPSFFKEVEYALSENLGTKVKVVKGKDDNCGTLCIEFYSHEELKELANKLEI